MCGGNVACRRQPQSTWNCGCCTSMGEPISVTIACWFSRTHKSCVWVGGNEVANAKHSFSNSVTNSLGQAGPAPIVLQQHQVHHAASDALHSSSNVDCSRELVRGQLKRYSSRVLPATGWKQVLGVCHTRATLPSLIPHRGHHIQSSTSSRCAVGCTVVRVLREVHATALQAPHPKHEPAPAPQTPCYSYHCSSAAR